jgi:hypothetical protein
MQQALCSVEDSLLLLKEILLASVQSPLRVNNVLGY